ncbi:Leucine-rich repeat containing protein [Hondaea fermentalgiana]|uniref:Leucine-rich repeat containing protein n=1 Tax=Hondaea fermentalgiana TaxID=2315210 RepID=A0A2R5H1J0_9STRA|nr:Leucine-rich repeat containing protein [Hondaea fermentalgiana]|eukprot:GBG34214.1 Leucine-rich repeat containing protein [Hondaea fermentalgiana]
MVRLAALLCRPREGRRRAARAAAAEAAARAAEEEEAAHLAALDEENAALDEDVARALDEWVEAARGDAAELAAREDAAKKTRRVLRSAAAAEHASLQRQGELLAQALAAGEGPVLSDNFPREDLIDQLVKIVEDGSPLNTIRTWTGIELKKYLKGLEQCEDEIEVTAWLTRSIGLDLSMSLISEPPPVANLPCSVDLSECSNLATLGDALSCVKGSLDLSDCPNLSSLGALQQVDGDLLLYACESLTELPSKIFVGQDLALDGCSALKVCKKTSCGGRVDLNNCSALQSAKFEHIECWYRRSYESLLGFDTLSHLVHLSIDSCTSIELMLVETLQVLEVRSFSDKIRLHACSSLREVDLTANGNVVTPEISISQLDDLEQMSVHGSLASMSARLCPRLETIVGDANVEYHFTWLMCPRLSAFNVTFGSSVTITMSGMDALVALSALEGALKVHLCSCPALIDLNIPFADEFSAFDCPELSSTPARVFKQFQIKFCDKIQEVPDVESDDIDIFGSAMPSLSLRTVNLLKLRSCNNLCEISVTDGGPAKSSQDTQTSNLANWSISACPMLNSIEIITIKRFATLTLKSLPELAHFSITHPADAYESSRCKVENLTLEGCGKVHSLDLPDDFELEKLEVVSCEELSSLRGILVKRELVATSCPSLESLCEVDSSTSVTIRNCSRFREIQMGETRSLSVFSCESFEGLPNNFSVDSVLEIAQCEKFTDLGEGLSAPSGVTVRECAAFTSLPKEMETSSLCIERCKAFENLTQVQGLEQAYITIKDCFNFIHIEAGLCATRLDFIYCSRLEEIPNLDPTVSTLTLRDCPNFVMLPEGLRVDKLVLTNSPCLSQLPQDFHAYTLDLTWCTSLTTLPSCVDSWGLEGHEGEGRRHDIDLTRSGVATNTDETERLGALDNAFLFIQTSGPDLTLREDPDLAWDRDDDGNFVSLESAVNTFLDSFGRIYESNVGITAPMVVEAVPSAYAHGVKEFLRMLFYSKEFSLQTTTRPGLLRRVYEVFDLLVSSTDQDVREGLCIRMADSGDACGDKPIWALNQMKQTVLVAEARGERQALRDLGRRLMRLEIVHEHVRELIGQLTFVDDVCVYLRFEIDLRERLDLPVSAEDMLFPNYVSIPDEAIEAAAEAALNVSEEDFEAWLQNWEEWQRQDRLEQSATLTLESLPRNSLKRISLSWQTLMGTRISDPVRLLPSRTIWSLKELLRHWVDTGHDLHNVSRSYEDLTKNLTRCI